MDEKALLGQIGEMLEGHTQRIEEMVDIRVRNMEDMVDSRTRHLEEMVDNHMLHMEQMLENHTQRIELKIEQDVTKRIEALFDGYKLTHEKQFELERDFAAMKSLVEDLQTRIAALENRIA